MVEPGPPDRPYQDAILARARNARGDWAPLYGFLDTYARFIAP